jgi:methyl-accepting chemotaxis protein
MVGCLAVVTIAAYMGLTMIQESQQNLYEQEFTIAVDLENLRSNQQAIRATAVTMMMLTKQSDQEVRHQGIKDRSKENDEIMRRLLERGRNDPQLLRRLEEFEVIRSAFRQTRETQVMPLIYAGKIDEAKGLFLRIQAERNDKMESIVDALVDEAKERARTAVMQSERAAQQAVRISVIVGVLALLLSVVMVALLNRLIANPFKEISRLTAQVAAGDLTVTAPVDQRADEVGTLAQTFRIMVENLREAMREMRDGVNVLAAASGEILAATTQLAAGAAETATAVSETTTTVEEVKQTAEVSSQKSRYVSESAKKTAEVSQDGKKSVDDIIEGMKRIQAQMESVAASIRRLSEQSQAIGEINTTVNDLAEQSNLLAVNAAIEAAKAGEHGKGFAVVAQEVKSLADQSKQATAQVRTLLNDIQKAMSAAVMATEQGSKAVETGMKQSVEAGQAITSLTDSIAESAQAAIQIAASSQQQLVGMDQVAGAMENIKQASAQNVTGMKQVEVTAQNLHDLGQKLKQLVEQYKVWSAELVTSEVPVDQKRSGVPHKHSVGRGGSQLPARAATQIAVSAQQQPVGLDQVALAMQHIEQASAQRRTCTTWDSN